MKIKRRRRLYLIVILICGMSTAVGLALYALSKNINLYFTPRQVLSMHIKPGKEFRLGGMVMKGSLHRFANSLQVTFVLTDYHAKVTVAYDGVFPSLFREGQGIVAQGRLNSKGVFVADQVLAKHDASYHPPGILK